MTSKVIYHLDTCGYPNWTQQERSAVEAFLRDHDIDPADVPVANRSGSLVVRMLDGGALELDLWVCDRVDGQKVRCPTCPCCVRRKRVKCEVHSALPVVSTAWIYGVDTTDDETDTTEDEFDAAMASGEPVRVVGTYASGSVKTIDYRTTIPPADVGDTVTTTVYVSIGNSDDKLTQSEWALFFSSAAILLQRHAKVHGQWCSEPASAWQNACWCVEIASKDKAEYIKAELVGLAQQFRQDSIAWAAAEAEFLTPASA